MLKLFLFLMLFQSGGLILPGPDFAIVFRFSIIKGAKAGIWCAFGVATGVLINVFITYLIGHSLYTFHRLLYTLFIAAGTMFLYYISINLMRNFFNFKQQTTQPQINSNSTHLSNYPFFTGLAVNLSNMKAIIFFSSLLPITGKLNLNYLLLTWISMAFIAWLWFSFVAIMVN
ncbi:MAG: LysE family transporter, partial [Burkholderiales bacterium]|nr:LysE family transporter [Burkholderiales bacterium]